MTTEARSGRLPGLAPATGRTRERALVSAAQTGSEEAIEELFRRHWPRAHRAAYLIIHDAAAAEDVAQESFLAAVRALDRFDRSRPFGPWLHRIAVNRAIDAARARKLRGEVAAHPAPVADPATGDAGEPPPRERLSDATVTALAQLSPEHRAVIVLRFVLEYTPGEIGEMLELPRGTVNSRMRRALDQLRHLVEPEAAR